MRVLLVSAVVSLGLSGLAHASGVFIPLETHGVQLTKVSSNGAYAVGTTFDGEGFRWVAATGAEEHLPEIPIALGINNHGTIAGAVVQTTADADYQLGAVLPLDASPVQLTAPLDDASNAYDVSDDGTAVGLSFYHDFSRDAIAFVWTAEEGMTALPVNRTDTYSRANVISADGHVIAGWNDQEDGFRTAVIWQDRVPLDVVDRDGLAVGEADGISADGRYVVGSSYTDIDGNSGAWLRDGNSGTVVMIPIMTFAFGVTRDGSTVVGNTGFFDDPARAAVIWRKPVGSMLLADFLAEQHIAVPEGWDLSGGLTGISADGRTLVGWGTGPGPEYPTLSYVVRLDAPDPIFSNGFDPR
ncbi:MAG: hypothetical protein ABW186_01465 [Rhodanobacteraceae bacterium]